MCTVATKVHELGSRDRHPLARLQRYYHTDETLDTNSTRRTNQMPCANVDRRRYGSAMQIPATTHGIVDQGGSICGPEKRLEAFAKVQTRSTSLDLTGRQRTDRTGLCCLGGRLGQVGYWNISHIFATRSGLVALARE